MKPIFWIILGALIMWLLLKIMAKVSDGKSDTTQRFFALTKTQEAHNLVRTNEFRELIKTREFLNLATSLADDQIKIISQTLTGVNIKK